MGAIFSDLLLETINTGGDDLVLFRRRDSEVKSNRVGLPHGS